MKFFCYFSVTGFSNTYIIGPDQGGDAIVIDPGIFDVPFLNLVESNNLNIRYILITHSHDSHILGVKTMLKVYEADIYSNSQTIFDFPFHKIRNGEILKLGDFSFKVIETPGHSGDSVIYVLDKFLFTGDTLFSGSIGATPDGFSKELLISVIYENILSLEDEYFVFPGHGPPSKVGIERLLNPYL